MAIQYHVAGPALIKLDTGTSNALESLGYTRDSAEIRLEARYEELKSDDMGGEQGPPGDLNYLGESATVRLELTKWDTVVADKVVARLYGGTAGMPGAPGTEMIEGAKTFRLLIHSTNNPMNFPRAILYGAVEINKGTRHSRLVLEFLALKDPTTGVLYNNVVT